MAGQAGVSEGIEVTPEMIEAGLKELDDSGRLGGDRLLSGDEVLVQQVFLAMWRCRSA